MNHDESVGKVFIVVGEDARKCLICEQLFTRQESFEHSMLICYPHTNVATAELPGSAVRNSVSEKSRQTT